MTLAARLQARGSPDALLRTSLFVAVSLTPLGIALPLVDSPALMLALLAPIMALSFGLFAVVPPIFSSLRRIRCAARWLRPFRSSTT